MRTHTHKHALAQETRTARTRAHTHECAYVCTQTHVHTVRAGAGVCRRRRVRERPDQGGGRFKEGPAYTSNASAVIPAYDRRAQNTMIYRTFFNNKSKMITLVRCGRDYTQTRVLRSSQSKLERGRTGALHMRKVEIERNAIVHVLYVAVQPGTDVLVLFFAVLGRFNGCG